MKIVTDTENIFEPGGKRRAAPAGAPVTPVTPVTPGAPGDRARADEGTPPKGAKRPRRDLRFRLAYTKPELSLVLPFGHTTLEEMIKRGAFPDGLRAHPTAHKIWPRRVIEEWLDKTQSRGAAG